MTPAEIARWLSSPWIATEVYKVEVNNSRAGPIVWLHQLPTFEPRLGVCTRRSWVVRYIPSEETPAASDPLVQPTGTTLSVRFRAARTAADCGADSSIDEWTSSTDSRSFAAGFRILREAVAIIGTRGRSSLRIECVNLVEPGSRICDKPDDLLRGLHPGMTAAIDQAVWSETLPRAQIFNPSNAAWRLIFPDPESPAVQDVVYVRGIQRPVAVRIERQDSRL